jgi:hypothetical protein
LYQQQNIFSLDYLSITMGHFMAIIRWTIGGCCQPRGFECLKIAVQNFQLLYPEAQRFICHNGLSPPQLEFISALPAKLVNQEIEEYAGEHPQGVAWKLRPPRLSPNCHEMFIDNDLIITERLPEIDQWLNANNTLGLEAEARHYGSFSNKVPKHYRINSGLFGLPPGFDMAHYLTLWGKWENNCPNQSVTWNEQGLVANTITHKYKPIIISKETIANCEVELLKAPGMHFVSLNRVKFHRPFAEYCFGLNKNLI